MKNKAIAIFSATMITVGAFGGVVFAKGSNEVNGGITEKVSTIEQVVNNSADKFNQKDTRVTTNFNFNSRNNPSKDTIKDMTKLMRENGFEDAARYMQTGDYEAMDDFMNNISQEDYAKMIEIMRENGYGSMADMMESIGRDEMINMHNAMGGMEGMHGSSGMMGGCDFDE